MSNAALLEALDLSVQIGDTRVTERLCLRINGGECWGILGKNGIGKTTLLHTLAGLLQPIGGSLAAAGTPLAAMPARARARAIGVLFQREIHAFPLSVLEAVMGGRHPHLGSWGWETAQDLAVAREALGDVAMLDLADRLTHSLSGGELQRVAIATLLAQHPQVALLDEPSNHLDLGQQIAMLQLLRGRFGSNGRAAVMVLHDINLALRFCDHLLLLKGNGQWLAGPVKKTATAENLSSLFGHPLASVSGPAGPALLPA